jgi:hypothetical protein
MGIMVTLKDGVEAFVADLWPLRNRIFDLALERCMVCVRRVTEETEIAVEVIHRVLERSTCEDGNVENLSMPERASERRVLNTTSRLSPVKIQRFLAARCQAAFATTVRLFLMLWPSSRTTRCQYVRNSGPPSSARFLSSLGFVASFPVWRILVGASRAIVM